MDEEKQTWNQFRASPARPRDKADLFSSPEPQSPPPEHSPGSLKGWWSSWSWKEPIIQGLALQSSSAVPTRAFGVTVTWGQGTDLGCRQHPKLPPGELVFKAVSSKSAICAVFSGSDKHLRVTCFL